MKTDIKGASQCKEGQENYETFEIKGVTYFQYDYRAANGELFTWVNRDLEQCREKETPGCAQKTKRRIKRCNKQISNPVK